MCIVDNDANYCMSSSVSCLSNNSDSHFFIICHSLGNIPRFEDQTWLCSAGRQKLRSTVIAFEL